MLLLRCGMQGRARVTGLRTEGWSADRIQDCLALYLQGAGAPGPSRQGRDGKQKLDTELRMYCEQIVDAVLIHKSVWPACPVYGEELTGCRAAALSPNAQQSIYRALVDFVQTEWVEGPCESGQSCRLGPLLTSLALKLYRPPQQARIHHRPPLPPCLPWRDPLVPSALLRAPSAPRSLLIAHVRPQPNPPFHTHITRHRP